MELTIKSNRPFSARLLGLVFFIPGLLFMSLPAFSQIKWQGDSEPPLLFTVTMGLVSAIIGLVQMLGENGATIDHKTLTIRRWLRLFITVNRSAEQIIRVEGVQLLKRIKQRGRIIFVVQINDKDLAKFTNASEARRAAESVAKYFQRDLTDSSMGSTIVREWKYLNESIADRIRRTREELPELETARAPKFIVVNHDGIKTISLNPDRENLAIVALVSMLYMILPGYFIFMIFKDNPGPPQPMNILLNILFAVLPAGVILIAIASLVWMLARKVTVTISSTGFEIEEKAGFFKRRTEMAYNNLEQIVRCSVPSDPILSKLSAGSITLANDSTEITIGKGLNEDDTAYLYAILMHAASRKLT